MPKQVHKRLTAREVATKPPGMYCDGNGLYLQVGLNSRSWIFRYKGTDGKHHHMGLGSAAYLPLADARDKAIDLQRQRLRGEDPLASRRAKRTEPQKKKLTLEAALRGYMLDHGRALVGEHQRNWIGSLHKHATKLLPLDVAAIDQQWLVQVFHPVWGRRVIKDTLSRVETLLDWATAHGYRTGDNPADWDRMKRLLPTVKPKVVKRAALPWKELPEFISKLRSCDGVVYRAIEFAILTAARNSEVTDAPWTEIEEQGHLWSIPAERMKAEVAHTVPLSGRAMEILTEMASIRQNGYVFPGSWSSEPKLGSHVMVNALKRLRPGITLHGFRATFSTWASEATRYSYEARELSLAHRVGSAVERSYNRGEMLAERRHLMEDWVLACEGKYQPKFGVVVPLRSVTA